MRKYLQNTSYGSIYSLIDATCEQQVKSIVIRHVNLFVYGDCEILPGLCPFPLLRRHLLPVFKQDHIQHRG